MRSVAAILTSLVLITTLAACVRRVDRAALAHDRPRDFEQGSVLMPIARRWRYAGSADGRDHLVYGWNTGLGISYRTYAVASSEVELPARQPLTDDERRWVPLVVVELTAELARFRRLGEDEIRAWEEGLRPRLDGELRRP